MNTEHYWLALSHLSGVGPVKIKQWLAHFKTVKQIFTASSHDLRAGGISDTHIRLIQEVDWQLIDKDICWLQQHNVTLLYLTHPKYPPLLAEIHNPPAVLYVQGDITLLSKPQIAIVGSRNPTVLGSELAHEFARELASAGLIVTSGLALGIDGAGHRGALSVNGQTIAILGTGLRSIYPASHRQLAVDIAASGAIVSEFALATPPKPSNFPIRNRIISGLSLGVLVVEAAERSGSLITAFNALEQNREVFALPGSLRNPRARGCHRLIREGAILVQNTADILNELNLTSPKDDQEAVSCHRKVDFTLEMQRVYHYVGYEITSLEAILTGSGLTASKVSSMLLRLELDGHVRTVIGGYMRTSH